MKRKIALPRRIICGGLWYPGALDDLVVTVRAKRIPDVCADNAGLRLVRRR